MGRVWCACFVVPLTLAAVAGLAAPVLLDRTLTMVAWAPMSAIAVRARPVAAARAGARDRRGGGGGAARAAAVVHCGSRGAPARTAPCAASKRWRVPATWSRYAPAGKAPEVQWTLGVRGHQPWKPVTLTDVVPTVAGLRLGGAAPTGRIWILDWNSRVRAGARVPTVCAGPALRGEPHPLPDAASIAD